jgi:hypothetical protein
MSKAEADALDHGGARVYIWLRAEYRDPVGTNRFTQECWFYNFEVGNHLTVCGPNTTIHR